MNTSGAKNRKKPLLSSGVNQYGMSLDTRLRAVKKAEGFGSGEPKKPVKRVSRVSRGTSKIPREACSETISIRPRGASSAPGSRSSVSRQQSRNGAEQTAERPEGRSDTIPRGDSTGQLSGTAPQSRDCPDDLRGTSKGIEGATPRYPHKVFVLDFRGQPLMPCSPRKARKLRQSGEAVVANRLPFTIRLKKQTSNHTQPLELKFDPGSKFTGIALVTNDAPVYRAELEHRGERIHQNLVSRAQIRRRRRNSNLRYRTGGDRCKTPVGLPSSQKQREKKPGGRFKHRVKPQGWLAPSLRHRLETITSWVSKFRRWAPITSIAQELVRFDLQKMENSEISGVEYQQGTLVGYEVREYLLEKWRRKCAYCGASEIPLEIEHVVSRARGGTNRISNLTIACHPCNQAKGSRPIEDFLRGKPELLKKVIYQLKVPLKDAAAVNTTRWALLNCLKSTGLPVRTGSGGRTKWSRARLKVPKSHSNDALCVGKVDTLRYWNIPTLIIKSIGRGSHKVVQTDTFGFPRTKLGEAHLRRGKLVRPKGELGKVRGLKGKRPFGLATGDTVKVPDGRIGRVTAARANGKVTVQIPGEKVLDKSAKHFELLERANGYSVHLD